MLVRGLCVNMWCAEGLGAPSLRATLAAPSSREGRRIKCVHTTEADGRGRALCVLRSAIRAVGLSRPGIERARRLRARETGDVVSAPGRARAGGNAPGASARCEGCAAAAHDPAEGTRHGTDPWRRGSGAMVGMKKRCNFVQHCCIRISATAHAVPTTSIARAQPRQPATRREPRLPPPPRDPSLWPSSPAPWRHSPTCWPPPTGRGR